MADPIVRRSVRGARGRETSAHGRRISPLRAQNDMSVCPGGLGLSITKLRRNENENVMKRMEGKNSVESPSIRSE